MGSRAVDPPEPPPRDWGRLLLDPRFGPYTLGRMLASTGAWTHNIAAAVLAFQLSGSAFVVALVSIAQFLPQLLLAPLSGAMADRGDRTRQIVVGRFTVIGGAGGMALWLWLVEVSDDVDVIVLVATSLVVGLGFVTGGPAMQALVPTLVRRTELATAVSFNTAPLTVGRALGPAIGSAVALVGGAPAAFAVAAALNVPLVVIMMRMRLPRLTMRSGDDRSIRAALAFVRADPQIAVILLCVAAVGIGADPAVTLAPSIAAEVADGAEHAGTFASAFGVGAGLGFVVIRLVRTWLGTARYGVLGFLCTAAGLVALAFAPSLATAVPAFAMTGIGMTLSLASLSVQLHERLPDELRGRVMAFWAVGFLGSRPLASGLNGAIADLVSVAAALLVVAALALAAAWLCRPGFLARVSRPENG